jgi:hypothetical protein
MSMVSATTDILTPGYRLVIRDNTDAPDGCADRANTRLRAVGRQSLVVRLFPAFICVQALLIAALLLLNYLDSIG